MTHGRGRTRRLIALSDEVNAYLTCWQSRDREFSVFGCAPIGETIDKLIRTTPACTRGQETGQLPALGKNARS